MIVRDSNGIYTLDIHRHIEMRKTYLQKQLTLLMNLWAPGFTIEPVEEERDDRRFAGSAWKRYPAFDYIRQSYLLASETLFDMVNAVGTDDETQRKIDFYVRQYLDAMAPTNFPLTNPEVLDLAVETLGGSLIEGAKKFSEDIEKGYISISDESTFEVGRNLGTTSGAVVYENELIQVIQYSPETAKVNSVPLVIVPSVVNKFYILDLTPQSSLVKYYVSLGYTVFIISWRSTTPELQHLTWDDYVEKGVFEAINVAQQISGQKKVNALGYCVGGTLLACALAVLAAKGEHPVSSMTLLISMFDYSDPGEIGVYLDPLITNLKFPAWSRGEIVSGRDLSRAFSSLRANDLVWSFYVSNYLKGVTPKAFDLFYWNSDDSNLPGPMFATYLDDFYSKNKLVEENGLTICGEKVSLSKIDVPTYIFNASEDHLVPWKGGFSGIKHIRGEVEFVLGGGGHITGPINPVSKNKRSYLVGGRLDGDADEWLSSAHSVQGSWWPHHASWLELHSGPAINARKRLGSAQYPVIEAAPGRYVSRDVSVTTA